MNKFFALLALLAAVCAYAPAAAADLTGKWRCTLETPGGDRVVDAEFTQDADTVTGKWGEADVSGKIKDGKLSFEFSITPEETGEKGTLKITLQPDGDGLTGTWEFGEYNGPLKGVRRS